ncbi:MAG: hypothetical protein FWD78_14830 [Treponema sp.]|nr:hypothetical protein [Treponema sp.]
MESETVNTETVKIEVMESVYERNEKLAAEFNKKLDGRKIFCVNVMGGPGVGKTSSLEKIIAGLDKPAFVIEGDIESDIDTRRLKAQGIRAAQINTGGNCHLDSPVVADAFEAALGSISAAAPAAVPDTASATAPGPVKTAFSSGYLFIENIGNLVCPAEFMIGEHIKLLISAVTEGSDKPWKYPLAFEKAGIILLNKCDLLPYVDFDWDFFIEGVRKLNPSAPVIKVSARTGEGYAEVISWLETRAKPVLK